MGGRIASERGHVAVIVDALRASATITSLLYYGVQEVEVVEQIDEALAERATSPDVKLLGERGGWQVEGFDYGNSPWQQAPDEIPERIVFTSSNCSRCCIAASGAPAAFLGATVNASAVARLAYTEAVERNADLCLIPAGSAENEERFILEDHLAAAVIIRRLQGLHSADTELGLATDAARASLILLDRYAGADLHRACLEQAFLQTDNGRRLSGPMPFAEDVRFAAQLDVFDLAPRLSGVRDLPSGGKAARLTAAR